MTEPDTTLGGWRDVLGQPAAVTAVRRALSSDEVAHAWLMTGPAGVGQAEVARALAMALNCPQATAVDTGCGECSTCRRIERGVHPASADLEPEGTFHVVDAVRGEWIPTATRTLTEGRRRVLRVVAADRMNDAAQNAFLKILEEPPPSVVWLLDVQDEGQLLDTVISRCRRVPFVAWGPDALHALAGRLGIADDTREGLVRAALGSPERLRALADPQVAAARHAHLGIVDRLAVSGPGVVFTVVKELVAWSKGRAEALKVVHVQELADLEEAFGIDGGRGWPPGVRTRITRRFERLEREQRRRALDLALDDVASWLRDLLVVRGNGADAALVNVDHLDDLRRDATRLETVDLVDTLRDLADCRDALDRNGNPDLQLERLFMRIALALYSRANAPAA